jgi:hypothetical protein
MYVFGFNNVIILDKLFNKISINGDMNKYIREYSELDDDKFLLLFGETKYQQQLFVNICGIIKRRIKKDISIASKLPIEIIKMLLKRYFLLLNREELFEEISGNIQYQPDYEGEIILINSDITNALEEGHKVYKVKDDLGSFYEMLKDVFSENQQMGVYMQKIHDNTKNKEDVIMFEEYSKHIVGVYQLYTANGVMKIYNVDTLNKIIETAESNFVKPRHPETREEIDNYVVQRIKRYHNLKRKYPLFWYPHLANTEDNIRTINLEFLNNLKNEIYNYDERTIDKYRMFIRPDFFLSLYEKDNLVKSEKRKGVSDRSIAEEILSLNNGKWLIRSTSVIGDENNIPFAVSSVENGQTIHYVYNYSKGKGLGSLPNINRWDRYDKGIFQFCRDFFFDYVMWKGISDVLVL